MLLPPFKDILIHILDPIQNQISRVPLGVKMQSNHTLKVLLGILWETHHTQMEK